jgi:ADP-ribose pyrophosphatase YjhB (NUDIX family)
MERLSLKRKLPSIIIIEGLWQIGKSKLVDFIADLNNYNIVFEPNHLLEKATVKIPQISGWYHKKHEKNIEKAKRIIKKGGRVILERSLISNVAYHYALTGKIKLSHKNDFNKIRSISNNNLLVVFLYADKKFINNKIKKIKDQIVRNNLSHNPNFYKNYIYFYKKILPKYIKTINIKVNKKTAFIETNKIYENILYSFDEFNKDKRICSSVVAFYNDNVLLLYDHNYKHYVLPQGHKNVNETLRNAAIREFTEETGYNSAQIIKNIFKYKYHYHQKNGRTVYKIINVYLAKILNLSKTAKKLENHENYSNKFFIINDAIKMAKWPQDKKALIRAKKYILN